MYATVKFEGLIDKILETAVSKGLAKTKIEALRLGALELNSRYHLIQDEDWADVQAIRESKAKLKSGKIRLHDEKELDEILKG